MLSSDATELVFCSFDDDEVKRLSSLETFHQQGGKSMKNNNTISRKKVRLQVAREMENMMGFFWNNEMNGNEVENIYMRGDSDYFCVVIGTPEKQWLN